MPRRIWMLAGFMALGVGCGAPDSDTAEHDHPRLQPWEERVDFAAFSPDGKMLLMGYYAERGGHELPPNRRALSLWDIESGRLLWMRTPVQIGAEHWLGEHWQGAFYPDGKQLLVLVEDRFKVYDVGDGTEKRGIAFNADGVTCYAVSPDGKTLLAGGPDGKVRLIDGADGKLLRSLDTGGRPMAVAFSPDGNLALSASQPAAFDQAGASCLWDVATGKALVKFPAIDGYREPIAFASDGKHAVIERSIGRTEHTDALVVFEVPGGKPTVSLTDGRSDTVAFTADGKGLLSAGRIVPESTRFPIVSKLELRELDGEKAVWSSEVSYRAAAFSPDGKLAFTAQGSDRPGIDGMSLKLWDTASGQVLRELKYPRGK